MSQDEEGNAAGLIAVAVFLVLLYILRAVFQAADQSK